MASKETDTQLLKAICFMMCDKGHGHGLVHMEETEPQGPVKFMVDIRGATKGKHGFHVHKSGNMIHAPQSLCEHFNPTGATHGNLNTKNSHVGDLGNIYFDDKNICQVSFIAKRVRLRGKRSIIGRSLIVHEKEDDLGRGDVPESKTTGNSGGRLFFGVIGIDSACENESE
jgi:Cu-Zn family superoxide dismutase